MRLADRLALYYERGVSSRRASIETGALLSVVRAHFRRFLVLGIQRQGRRLLPPDRPARPYTGPEWIGLPIGQPPFPEGPGWTGKRCETHSVRWLVH
jgi:hypothetical protein